MPGGNHSVGDHVRWNGTSSAVEEIGDLLAPVAPTGALRVVLQRLTLHDGGAAAGEHEVIDAVTDVSGNLVAVPFIDRVRSDAALAAALDAALVRLRGDLAASGAEGVDSLEVVIDADGTQQVRIAFGTEVSPAEVHERPPHPAVHDGIHHITYYAPVLDDLRERIAAPEAGWLRRGWQTVRDWLRGAT